MAWSWSHTTEAHGNAEQNLRSLPADELRTIYGEWFSYRPGTPDADYEGFVVSLYDQGLDEAETLSDDVLADVIWDRAAGIATCDNGGFNAWVCPYGCHTVSFDSEGDEPQ